MKRSLKMVLVAALAVSLAWAGNVWAAGEITIGVAVSMTGRYAEPAGRFVNSWKMYVDEYNKKGGWLGKKIILKILDDKSDKQQSIKLFEKLITQDKVDFTMGPYSSGITDAVANILERYKYPTMAPGAASGIIWKRGRKYLFNIIAVAQDYQKGALHIAQELGIKRLAVVNQAPPRDKAHPGELARVERQKLKRI